MAPLPAVVTIFDLATTTSLSTTAVFEAQFTSAGNATTVQVSLSQMASTILTSFLNGTGGWPVVANGTTSAPSVQQLNLATTGVTGTLPMTRGGVGTNTLTPFGVVWGAGTATVGVTAAGTTGWSLVANGTLAAPTFQQINLTTGATGVLSVPFGGTNTSTLTVNGVIYGAGTSTVGITALGATGTMLQSNGTAPFFTGAARLATSLVIGVNSTPAAGTLLTVNNNSASPSVNSGTLFQVVGADAAQPFGLIDSFEGGAGINKNPFLVIRAASGTGGAFSAITSGRNLGFFGMVGAYTANTFASPIGAQGGVFFGGVATETWNATSMGSEIRIFTTPTGAAAVARSATFQNSGGVSVGTTTDPGIGALITSGKHTILSGTGLATAGTAVLLFGSVSSFGVFIGTGVPSVSAGTGSIFLRNDGATATSRIYVNSSGGTTWVGLTAVA